MYYTLLLGYYMQPSRVWHLLQYCILECAIYDMASGIWWFECHRVFCCVARLSNSQQNDWMLRDFHPSHIYMLGVPQLISRISDTIIPAKQTQQKPIYGTNHWYYNYFFLNMKSLLNNIYSHIILMVAVRYRNTFPLALLCHMNCAELPHFSPTRRAHILLDGAA